MTNLRSVKLPAPLAAWCSLVLCPFLFPLLHFLEPSTHVGALPPHTCAHRPPSLLWQLFLLRVRRHCPGSLPRLHKLMSVPAAAVAAELRTSGQLPIELDLGPEFVFHPIFACPVSR